MNGPTGYWQIEAPNVSARVIDEIREQAERAKRDGLTMFVLDGITIRWVEPDSLDAAWAEAEAALPEGPWLLEVLRRGVVNGDENPYTGYVIDAIPERYEACAGNTWSGDEGPRAFGPTPAAALRALVARLREVNG